MGFFLSMFYSYVDHFMIWKHIKVYFAKHINKNSTVVGQSLITIHRGKQCFTICLCSIKYKNKQTISHRAIVCVCVGVNLRAEALILYCLCGTFDGFQTYLRIYLLTILSN